MNKFAVLTFAATLIFVAQPSFAAPESPEQVVARYNARFAADRWLALTEFLHPEDLKKFKQQFLSLFSDDNATTRESLVGLYGPGVTIKSLEVAAPAEFMRPILSIANRSLDASNLRVTSQVVLGSVGEGDLRHVVYRWESETPSMKLSQVEVRTLRMYGDSWYFLIPMNIENTIPVLKRAMQQQAK